MEDIKCKDCGDYFTLTDGEKDFYNLKGLNLPLRCKPCRAKKKAKFEDRTEYGNFEMRTMR